MTVKLALELGELILPLPFTIQPFFSSILPILDHLSDESGTSPLMYAIKGSHAEIVQELVARGEFRTLRVTRVRGGSAGPKVGKKVRAGPEKDEKKMLLSP